MRQLKRTVNRIFPVIVLLIVAISAVTYTQKDIIGPIVNTYTQTQNQLKEQERLMFAAEQERIQENAELLAQATKIQSATGSILGTGTGPCPNPNGTCVSDFINNYIFTRYGDTEGDTVRYTDIGFVSRDVRISYDGNPSGSQTQFCGLDNPKTVAISMKLKEAPILPNFYKNGVEKGLPIREGAGEIDATNRAYVSAAEQTIKIEDLPYYCSYSNYAYRTNASYGLEPKLGGDQSGLHKGSPFFWKACAAITNTKEPQADLYSDDPLVKMEAINKHWEGIKSVDLKANVLDPNGSARKYVAYKMAWNSASGLRAEDDTKGIFGQNGWAFDPPGNRSVGADAMLTETFNINTPPSTSNEAGDPRTDLLARTTLSVDYISKSVLDIFFSQQAYVFAPGDKDTNVRLSYDPYTQKNEQCDYNKGECPLVPAEARCTGGLGLNLSVEANPGILQINTTPDYITNASTQKAMQRAMHGSLNYVNAPSGALERATIDDIILAAAPSALDSSCNGKFTRSPDLSDEEFASLQDYYRVDPITQKSRASTINKGAALFYKIQAEFYGKIKTGSKFIGYEFTADPRFDGDVIAFTVLPIQNLTSFSNNEAFNDQFQDAADAFRDTVMRESGLVRLQYKLRCEGSKVNIEFQNIQ